MSSHHGFLVAVEKDLLAGDTQFPTGLKVLAALRRVLDDPDASVEQVSTVVGAEPLVMARLLRLANCATFNPTGQEILTVERAIQRIGFKMVRTAAAAVAIAQMRAGALAPHMAAIADQAWLRSVRHSALARVLAPRHDGAQPDEAGLCGLVSELGVFYLLQRATRYPTYSDPSRVGALRELLEEEAAHITARLAATLGLPEPVTAVLAQWRQGGQCVGTAQALLDCLEEAAQVSPLVFDTDSEASGEELASVLDMSEMQASAFVHEAREQLQDLSGALGGT